MLHKMFHALADVWRVFIFCTAEYQTTIAAVVFSTDCVRQILRTICTMPCTCDTTCVILSRLSLATGQYLRVASYKSFSRLYILPLSVQSIELLMQTNSILSPSSGIIFSILFLVPDTYSSHEVGCWHWVNINYAVLHRVKTLQRWVSKPVTVIPRGFMPK